MKLRILDPLTLSFLHCAGLCVYLLCEWGISENTRETHFSDCKVKVEISEVQACTREFPGGSENE